MFGSVFVTCILLGVGIAADAFLAALSNGLKAERGVRSALWKILIAAAVFAAFHTVAAAIGTVCVRAAVGNFDALGEYTGAVAAAVFCALGIKSVYEGLYQNGAQSEHGANGIGAIMIQSAATSVDALSAGFVMVTFDAGMIAVCLALIAAITYAAYVAGFGIGRRFGMSSGRGAAIVGGVIFIAMGIAAIS